MSLRGKELERMRLPVFGKAKYPREEMERIAALELAAALEMVPQPPDPSMASWGRRDPVSAGASTPPPVATAPLAPEAAAPAAPEVVPSRVRS